MFNERDTRQVKVLEWVREVFGDVALAVEERVTRVVEEVVELAQAEGVSREQVLHVVDHVYGRKRGEVFQEVGGVGVTLLAYCQVRGISADYAERQELHRVLGLPAERFRARQAVKAEAGIGVKL